MPELLDREMIKILTRSGEGAARAGLDKPGSFVDGRALDARLLRGGRMTKWKGEVASYAPNLAQLVSAVEKFSSDRLLAVALLAGFAASPASAADRYWDVNGTGIGLGGTGAWNNSSLFWNESSNGVSGPMDAWNNAAPGGDTAIFDGTAGTVSVGGSITAGGLSFNTTGYTVSGGTLTLTGATPTIFVAAAPITATINSGIAGSAGQDGRWCPDPERREQLHGRRERQRRHAEVEWRQ